MLLGAGCTVWGGGTRPEAAGAVGCSGKEEPAAEGASSQGEAFLEERPQSCTQGWAAGTGAATEAKSLRENGGTSPQHYNTEGASTRGLHKCSDTSQDATLNRISTTHLDCRVVVDLERLLGGLSARDGEVSLMSKNTLKAILFSCLVNKLLSLFFLPGTPLINCG